MTTYTETYTYDAEGNSHAHNALEDCCAWLAYHLDDDKTVKVVEIEFDELTDRVVWATDITKTAAEKLADDWRDSETVMIENPNALAETVISIDTVRYEIRMGV